MEGTMNPEVVKSLQAAGFEPKQALAIAAVVPDLEPHMDKLRGEMHLGFAELRGEMKDMQSSLIRWMVGIFMAFTTLLGTLLTWANLFQ